MMHYTMTPQERTQVTGRWHGSGAPLCGTGDGHHKGTNPEWWSGQGPAVTCTACCDRKHLLAPRERDRTVWRPSA